MIDQLISELVAYGLQNGLIEDADKVYVTTEEGKAAFKRFVKSL